MRRFIPLVCVFAFGFFAEASPGDTITSVRPRCQLAISRVGESNVFPASVLQREPAYDLLDFDFYSTVHEERRRSIEATYEKVNSENRFVDYLDAGSLIQLPAGMKTTIGLFTYTVLLDSIVMKPLESLLYASMVIETPRGRLHFSGRDIPISRTGGISGTGRLMLEGDYQIGLDGGNAMVILKGSAGNTFVEFDCGGYKQLSIDGSVLFSRDVIVPEKPDGFVDASGNVAVDFRTTVVTWEDIVLSVAVPRFQVAGLTDISFSADEAIIDLSDTRDPPAIRFPAGHYAAGSPPGLWEGVFIRQLSIALPRNFTSRRAGDSSGAQRLSLKASELLLDASGISGSMGTVSLLDLADGRIGTWNFSIDSFSLRLLSNEIVEGALHGRIRLPLQQSVSSTSSATENDLKHAFRYSAVVQKGRGYVFNLSTPDTLDFDLWKAAVRLHPSSSVQVLFSDSLLLGKALLNGNISIAVSGKKGSGAGDGLKIPSVAFENLVLQTERPFLKPGDFSLGSGQMSRLGGVLFSINRIAGYTKGDDVHLDIDASLALTEETAGGMEAKGTLRIVSRYSESGGQGTFSFHKLEVDRFSVDIDRGAFSFRGGLDFFSDDAVYGSGISGSVAAKFQPGFSFSASAIFGSVQGTRYWCADVLMSLKTGVMLVPPLAFHSFGGGAYYHMRMADRPVASALTRTPSGITYVPDPATGLGVRAVTGFAVQSADRLLNADVTYEMSFTANGGIRNIRLGGNAYLLSDPISRDVANLREVVGRMVKSPAPSSAGNDAAESEFPVSSSSGDAPVLARIAMEYDFQNRSLHALFAVHVNAAGGAVKGVGPQGRAGQAVLHIAPDAWYLYLGTPDPAQRIGLEVAGLARLDAYFVTGSVVPPSPRPPEKIARMLSIPEAGYSDDPVALQQGAGIGFGASLSFNTGDLKFLIFYARFAAAVGFDLMLRDYGRSTCSEGVVPGINGWYASGQAYAFLEGRIGINVRVMKQRRKVNILEIGAAVLLEAKLPNPSWFRGTVGGYFNVLGGLVKGTCRFQVELGRECEIIQDEGPGVLESVDVIAGIEPGDGANDVNVFTVPRAVFNYEIGKEYQMPGENGQPVIFRLNLDEFTAVTKGTMLRSAIEWNADGTVAGLNPFEILPPQSEITVTASVSFQEKRGDVWSAVLDDGKPLKETRVAKFHTGAAPDHIPPGNVLFSYPLRKQLNYYAMESRSGFVRLRQGQRYLFDGDHDHALRLTSASGEQRHLSARYDPDEKEVTFEMPETLPRNTTYQIEIIRLPHMQERIGSKVDTVNLLVAGGAGNSVTARRRVARGAVVDEQPHVVYESFFRTSHHATFDEKLGSLAPSSGWRDPIIPGVHAIGVNFGGPEPFSYEEIYGGDSFEPLVQLEADLSNVPWFSEKIFPLLYNNYPIHGLLSIANRDVGVLGVVPSKAVFVYQYPYNIVLESRDLPAFPTTVGRFDYYLAWYMYNDFVDLSNQAARYSAARGKTPETDRLLQATFPAIMRGEYKVNVRYVIPGGRSASTRVLRVFNPF